MISEQTSLIEMAGSRGAFVVVLCLLCYAVADFTENDVEKGFQMLYKSYQACENRGDLVPCLKVKAVRLADRALKINSIPVFEGLTVVRNDDADARAMGVEEFNENALPEDDVKKDEVLDSLLLDRVMRFFKTHSVQFGLPKLTDGENDIAEGRRRKLKKYMGPMIMAAMMKGGMLMMATKAVALLAAKALLVAKIAFVLASIIAVKKLFSSGGGGESKTIEIVQKPQISHSHAYTPDFGSVGGSGGWEASGHGSSGSGGYARRSLDTSVPFPEAQELAYRGRARH